VISERDEARVEFATLRALLDAAIARAEAAESDASQMRAEADDLRLELARLRLPTHR
jgi:hypothetical protein